MGNRDAHPPASLRQRMQAEGGLGDHAQRPEGSGEELPHVVARHVLHDLAAGASTHTVGADEGHPDEEVTDRAVQVPGWAGRSGGDQAADRATASGIHTQPLTGSRKGGLEIVCLLYTSYAADE